MKVFYTVVLLGFLALTACDLEQDCSGTMSANYSIGTDVTSDFNVNDVSATAEVLTSDCSNLPVGETVTETLDNVTRSGSTITMTDGEEDLQVTASGTTIQQFTRSHTIAGCTITVILEGSLNTTTNQIETSGAFAANGLTCNQSF